MKLFVHARAGHLRRSCDELTLHPEAQHIDLSLAALGWAAPLFLVRLRAWLEYHARLGITVSVAPPLDDAVSSYMARMRIAAGLDWPIDFPLPAVNERASETASFPSPGSTRSATRTAMRNLTTFSATCSTRST